MNSLLKKTVLLLLVIIAIVTGCKKDRDNSIPDAPVDIYIYTSSPSFVNLSAVGGWVYITGGVRGILVYRKSSFEFMAYERNCTYQPNDACATVEVDYTNIIVVDSCCNSKFSIYDGSVINSPALVPLRAYSTTFDGATLHIYN
jgi:nitrite reductase/ring-hydroxylating ferredoxin subunit